MSYGVCVLLWIVFIVGVLKLLAFICDPEGHAIKENKALRELEKKRFQNLKK